MPAKRPRIADVARRAGVSEGTVSVVLNNRVGEQVRVSPQTQQKVWDAVRDLGYVANPVAQNLAGGQNRIIAIFTFESIFPLDSRSFYYPFLIGIEEAADANGYDLLLVTGSDAADNGVRHIYQRGVNRLKRADGGLLLGHGPRHEVLQLIDESYPFVFVGRRTSPGDVISYVAADYTSASAELVDHLVSNGHRGIAFIRSVRATEASQDRETGVLQALAAHQLVQADGWLWRGEPAQFSPRELRQYLDQSFTAFVAEDDELATQILAAGHELGLSCPADFSLVVLGNALNPLAYLRNWTSFNIPRREMGRKALETLIHLLELPVDERKLPLRTVLPCTFKAGDSVRAL